jgi:integrase
MPEKITPSTVTKAKRREKPYEIRGQLGLILRIQPTGKKTFYCEYGRGKRVRIGDATVLTVGRAEYRAREILNEAQDFENPLRHDLTKSTLGGFIEQVYAPWLRSNRRRRCDTTLADLKRNFGNLYTKRLTDITNADLDRYVSASLIQGRSAATMRRSLNNLQRVLRLAVESKPAPYLRESPFKGWEKPEVEEGGAPRYLLQDEERRLRIALIERDERAREERVTANDWRRARDYKLLPEFGEKEFTDHVAPMVLLSLNTGLRYGELASLEWNAVDLQTSVLTVTGRTAKSAKMRHVPLNAEAIDVLTRWRPEAHRKGLVFTNADGSRIGSVKTAWSALLKAASITGFRWHDLRHTFASKLVQRGVALPVVRELLGHGDFKLTLRYAHLDDKQKVDAVASLAA